MLKRYSDTRINYFDQDIAFYNAVRKTYASLLRKFGRVRDQIRNHLRDSLRIGMDENVRQSIEVTDQRNLFRHFQRVYLILLMKDLFQTGIGKRVIQDARFYFGKIKYVSNQTKEQITILIDYFDKLFFFFFIVSLGKNIGKADYSVKRRPDLMAHIGEESRFQLIRLTYLLYLQLRLPGFIFCMVQFLFQQFFFGDVSNMADHFVLSPAPFRLISLRIDTNPDRFVFNSGTTFKAAMILLPFYHLEKQVDIIGRTNNLLYTFDRHILIISQIVEKLVILRCFVQKWIDKQFFLFNIIFGNKGMAGQEDSFQDRQIVLRLLLFGLFFRFVGNDQQIADMPKFPVVQPDSFHHQIFGFIGNIGMIIAGIPYTIEIVCKRKTECLLLLDLIKNFLWNSRILEQVDS